jgi:Flp pilus assembly protein TadG
MAAASLMPAMITVGAAIDYSRIFSVRSSMTSALDSAVLSAAKGLSSGALLDSDVEDHIKAMVAANTSASGIRDLTYTVSNITNDSANGTLTANIETTLPMAFMSLVNISSQKVTASIEATYGNQQVELTMMLDVTGSMYGSKISALKTAAKDAVKILLPINMKNKSKTRIGLVPYSYSINAGNYANNVTNNLSTKCVTERGGTEAFSDASPVTFPVGADPRAVTYNYCPSQAVRPLTSKRKKLLNDINSYSAGGYTAGHLGIAWSYYMLSPKWNAIWPTKSDANPYNDGKTLKVALLMTDGIFNTYYDGTTGTAWGGNATPSNAAAAALCQDMRNRGIVVYSVAFEAPSAAQAILQNCATPDAAGEQHYYNAQNATQLKQAFANIAKSINTLRLSK